jgi:hypothetical protein
MNRSHYIRTYIRNPNPLWDLKLVEALVRHKLNELVCSDMIGNDGIYHTSNMLGYKVTATNSECFFMDSQLPIEFATQNILTGVYKENGLETLSSQEIVSLSGIAKLNKAMDRLKLAGDCGRCVSNLVKALQILRQIEPEYDVSYSHPDIPFTIFVSVGVDGSQLESLRLSESILHESMHLFLSLIEEQMPLIRDNAQVFYSPWRETERPLRGVLHGMFVFQAVLQFYTAINVELSDPIAKDFAEYRSQQIKAELEQLQGFSKCKGLTIEGALLAASLIT